MTSWLCLARKFQKMDITPKPLLLCFQKFFDRKKKVRERRYEIWIKNSYYESSERCSALIIYQNMSNRLKLKVKKTNLVVSYSLWDFWKDFSGDGWGSNRINWKERIAKTIFQVSNRRLNVGNNVNKLFVKSVGCLLWFR